MINRELRVHWLLTSKKSGLGHPNHMPWAFHQEWKEIPFKYLDKKGFPETSVTQFCLLSSPLCKKASWTWFCPHAFQFIFPPASLISYFRKLPNIYILDIFTLDKSWNAPWLSAYMLCASPLWTHIVPSRPFGRTARHPKTQFIPGTASAILGTGQIVSFLSLWLGGGTPLPPFLFDLHPPQNRQTDSFILACLLKTEENRGNMRIVWQKSKQDIWVTIFKSRQWEFFMAVL